MTHPTPTDYYTRYFSQAVGLTIARFEWTQDGFPAFVCNVAGLDEPISLEISSDEEGNAAGFIFGLPLPSEPVAPPNTGGEQLPDGGDGGG